MCQDCLRGGGIEIWVWDGTIFFLNVFQTPIQVGFTVIFSLVQSHAPNAVWRHHVKLNPTCIKKI